MNARRAIPATEREQAIESLGRLLAAYLPGRELVVTVEELRHPRTAQQRAALFGCAYKALMEQMGLRGDQEKARLHEGMCGDYFGWKDVTTLGTVRQMPVRTTTTDENGERDEISIRDALDFYAFIQQRAAEYGYDVPDPDPAWRVRAKLDAELDARAAARRGAAEVA